MSFGFKQSNFPFVLPLTCFVRDDVSNVFFVIERAQRIIAMGNRKVRLGITKLVPIYPDVLV